MPSQERGPAGNGGRGRVILHIDMNAFYCSVHEAEEPERYAGKPIAVAGSVEERRGVIVTSSYAAREKGVRTGMTVRQGLKVCPELIIIRPDFNLYRKYSRGFLGIARQYTPLVEVVSIDECYLDVTGSGRFGTPLEIAEEIRRRIRTEWSLPCSIGIGPNKLLAKMASDMKKPNGITVLRIRDVPAVLWHRPCDALHGVGRKTAAKLARMNIRTIGELAACDERTLIRAFGAYGAWMKRAANGIDTCEVNPERGPNKSIGHSTTLPRDVTDPEEAGRVFLSLADRTARRLRRQGLVASTVQIAIRTPDMRTRTRAETLERPTDDPVEIHRVACRLFQRHHRPGEPVRLLGITLANLSPKRETAVQLDLFDLDRQPKREALIRTMDELRDRFGEEAVLTAGMLLGEPAALSRNRRIHSTSLQTEDELLYSDE